MDPIIYEERVMKSWDGIRELLLVERDDGSLPRDIFESIADFIYDTAQQDVLKKLAVLLPEHAELILSQNTEVYDNN